MSPRTKEQNEEIREARIRQIRAAAADVYLTRGMAFEIKDVAAAAGVGYGTVYHYYVNKYVLFHDMLGYALDASGDATARAFAAGGGWARQLRELAVGLLRLWQAEPAAFILYKMASEKFHQLPAETVGALPERFEAELFRPLAALLAGPFGSDGGEEAAGIVVGALIGCAGMWLYRREQEMDAERMVDLLLAGITDKAASREERVD